MIPRDWIFLLIPIFLNGVLIFALQKRFEKRQFSNAIKHNHILELLRRIDEALSVMYDIRIYSHNRTEDPSYVDNFVEKINTLHNKNIDIYFWMEQNENTFRFVKKETADLKEHIDWFFDNKQGMKEADIAIKLEELFKALQEIKAVCETVKL
ncbi:MAG: hypothetical protein FWE29_02800 [Defluviitaleaceae bacterium]|nr:hypothetical protein [Defluviitaleaceae bacterium]